MKKSSFSLILVLFANAIWAQVEIAKIFSSNMVLQREVEIPVWGWANPGITVTLEFQNQTYRTKTDLDGNWLVTLPEMEAGGPYSLIIRGSDAEKILNNIMIGDVWLCSGQSNMEWTVANSNNAQKEIANAKDINIRHFKVPNSHSYSPEAKLAGGTWETCSSETVEDFTAVGYFFARELRTHTKVPIGLLNSSWGGSRIEPWISAQGLGAKDARAYSENIKKEVETITQKRLAYLEGKLGRLPKKDEGFIDGQALWAKTNLDDQDWATMDLPGLWEGRGLEGLDGILWYRKTIVLSAEDLLKEATLNLAKIDDSDITWVNGQKVGGMEAAWNKNRSYTIPENVLKVGKNVITIRVEDTGGGGGVYGDSDLLSLRVGGKIISLVGEWKYKIGAFTEQSPSNINQTATLLYNKMIHPILRFPIRGVIWYQGESNAGNKVDAIKYQELFPVLIKDWRRLFNTENLPFLFVQLANFLEPTNDANKKSNWAFLRESQSRTLSVPNTGQAVIIDIGEANDIHPRNKQDVGVRLSLAARKIAYQESLVYSGPVFKSMKIEGDKVRLQFDHIGSGLFIKDKYGYLKAFAVAGVDRQFVWAQAKVEGNEVVVWSPAVKTPQAVRYAWGDNPEDANLYNKEGLPASPFRTDQWDD